MYYIDSLPYVMSCLSATKKTYGCSWFCIITMQLQKKFGHIVRQHTFIMVTRKVSMVQKVGSQASSKCQLKYYSDDLCHPKASFNDET